MKRRLHITNGAYFNEYFIKTYGENAVPFNEAMMDGETTEEIYSDAFIRLRANELGVSEEIYRSKMDVYHALSKGGIDELHLWFGKDAFCQMNLLTLLAYVEQIGYAGEVTLHTIDDETFQMIGDEKRVILGEYRTIFEEIFVCKRFPMTLGVLEEDGIRLYFDYHSPNGKLVRLVKKNADKDRGALVRLLMENSKEYGLSDLQAEKIIDMYL